MRITTSLCLVPLLFALPAALSFAQEPEPAKSTEAPAKITREAAISEGVRILVSYQERYKSDAPVGRLETDELESWQEKEMERLKKVREPGKRPAQEWPYEGVYRVRPFGAIPSGYRVGGTAI
ncbi:MAG: hypothetical protein P1V35_00570, partial [Planctomycetota bacterium]|nr:hypothetical protein [Planctomycetota bacterium]